MTALVARALFPFTLIIGVALWAKGYAHIGDGFSAGMVAGLGAVVQYVCLDHDRAGRVTGARFAWPMLVAGLLTVLAVLVAPSLFGAHPVTHLPPPGSEPISVGVAELHTALLFDFGVAVLVYGALVGTFDRLFPPFVGDEP